jgi:tetratricopeptide (TPR) repeat protein
MHPTRIRAAVLGALVSVAAAGPAHALDARVDPLKAAADEAFRQGDHLRALVFLEQAYALDPQPGILANRALILERLGDHKRALTEFEAYLATDPSPEKRAAAETAVRRLKPEVIVTSEPPGAQVYLDDGAEAVGATPLRTPLPSGAHLLRVSLEGFSSAQSSILVEPGRPATAHFKLVGGLGPQAQSATTTPSNRRTVAYVALATGVLAAAAGGTFAVLLHDTVDDRDDADTRTRWNELDQRAQTWQVAAGSSFGASAVAIGTGLWFFFAER